LIKKSKTDQTTTLRKAELQKEPTGTCCMVCRKVLSAVIVLIIARGEFVSIRDLRGKKDDVNSRRAIRNLGIVLRQKAVD
jgi:hypothetical protein